MSRFSAACHRRTLRPPPAGAPVADLEERRRHTVHLRAVIPGQIGSETERSKIASATGKSPGA